RQAAGDSAAPDGRARGVRRSRRRRRRRQHPRARAVLDWTDRKRDGRGVNLLIGAVTIGLILSLLALGVFLTYRIFGLLDVTTDGAFGVGAATAAALVAHGSRRPAP